MQPLVLTVYVLALIVLLVTFLCKHVTQLEMQNFYSDCP